MGSVVFEGGLAGLPPGLYGHPRTLMRSPPLPPLFASSRRVLEDAHENAMVRHEAAEALGSIAAPECLSLLKEVRMCGGNGVHLRMRVSES